MTYSVDVKFSKGDKRITYTSEYVITEIVTMLSGTYKNPVWEIISIERIDKDKNVLLDRDGI